MRWDLRDGEGRRKIRKGMLILSEREWSGEGKGGRTTRKILWKRICNKKRVGENIQRR